MCAYYAQEVGGLPPPASTTSSVIAGRLVRGCDLPAFNGKQVSLLGVLSQLEGTSASVRSVDGMEIPCTLTCAPIASLQSAVIACGEARGNALVNCFRLIPLGGDLDPQKAEKVLSLMHHPGLSDLYTAAAAPPPQ
ncbi:hypothetical protein Efla_007588 [Eimeria flavescens]